MLKKIKKEYQSKPEIIIFLFLFIFLMILGILLSYNYQMKDNYNLLFDSDTARVIMDATEIAADHYRVNVHPLFVLFIQPLCFIINGIFLNKMLSIIFLSSLASSLSVLFLYKIAMKSGNNRLISFLIALLYLFSFSNMIFTSGIETYNFAAFFLILLWYYYINKKDEYTKESYFILIVLGILSFSFTITNFMVFLIVLFFLWISKKIQLKQAILTTVVIVISVFGLNIGQKLIWNNTPFFWKTSVSEETTNFGDHKISFKNIKNVIENDYYNSIMSPNINLKVKYGSKYNGQNYIISFQKESVLNTIMITFFYLLLIILIIRNFKKNLIVNSALLLTLLFNTLLHIIYGNSGAFLYSLHFLYIILLLLIVNIVKEKDTKILNASKYFLIIFLGTEIINNNIIFGKVLNFVSDNISKNYLLANLSSFAIILEILILLFCIIAVFIIKTLIKKIKKVKNKEQKISLAILISAILIAVECPFIWLNSIEAQNKFLWIDIKNKETEIEAKTKKEYMSKSFQETFKTEIEKLEEYQQEYLDFQNTYQVETTFAANWYDYYFMGMANRRKLLYQPNQIIDIETKKIIETFEEKEHYIIPNLYMVLIETRQGDFIKIVEDKDGVHFIKNGKDKVLEGTNIPISLYSFENQKYSNINNILYGEILWNIKDSTIYPNIIVYHKPWYRDAAITSMVLKQTNNTDLISEWVEQIEDIYDRQNAGIEEADNLGELLYILSTQKNRRDDLINKIEEEAKRIARENPNGYYLYGKTDFGDQYLYQNLWYQLGIESVGGNFEFDLSQIPEDNYSKMAWWSPYQVKDQTEYETSEEYPYLSFAARHKLGKGTIIVNENLYPLSMEINASQANYENYREIENGLANAKISPLHSWSASELLLWLLDESGDLSFY